MHHQKSKTLDEAHCYQASRGPSMTIDRPPLPMANTNRGYRAQYLKVCAKCVGVMCEWSNLRITQPHLQNNQKIPRQIQV